MSTVVFCERLRFIALDQRPACRWPKKVMRYRLLQVPGLAVADVTGMARLEHADIAFL